VALLAEQQEKMMGILYDLKAKIDKAIEDKKLDGVAVRGKIALQAGFLLSLIAASSPDDLVKIDKLKKAAASVMQLNL
jgi:hypothetical protein